MYMETRDIKCCPRCSAEINKSAVVCMHCRRDIGATWQKFKLPEFLFFIILVLFFFNTLGWFWFSPQFKEYQGDFIVSQVNSVELPENKGYRLIFQIENKTNMKWKELSYQLIGSKDDLVLDVETGNTYQWVVQPLSSSYLSVDSVETAEGVSWELKIKSLKVPLF